MQAAEHSLDDILTSFTPVAEYDCHAYWHPYNSHYNSFWNSSEVGSPWRRTLSALIFKNEAGSSSRVVSSSHQFGFWSIPQPSTSALNHRRSDQQLVASKLCSLGSDRAAVSSDILCALWRPGPGVKLTERLLKPQKQSQLIDAVVHNLFFFFFPLQPTPLADNNIFNTPKPWLSLIQSCSHSVTSHRTQ